MAISLQRDFTAFNSDPSALAVIIDIELGPVKAPRLGFPRIAPRSTADPFRPPGIPFYVPFKATMEYVLSLATTRQTVILPTAMEVHAEYQQQTQHNNNYSIEKQTTM